MRRRSLTAEFGATTIDFDISTMSARLADTVMYVKILRGLYLGDLLLKMLPEAIEVRDST